MKALATLGLLLLAGCEKPQPPRRPGWYKGNTHAHTNLSDGDSSPRAVVRWYKDHGYQFLAVTDHDRLDWELLGGMSEDGFVLVPGEEVTSTVGGLPVHVNGLGIDSAVKPSLGNDVLETLQLNINAVRDASGIAQVNHPNFGWALDADTLSRARGYALLEIFTGHPSGNTFGGAGRPGAEQLWDKVLSEGRIVYGVAVDDAHHFQGLIVPGRADPGRGWVVARAPALSARAVTEALERGDFYASSGVELDDIVADKAGLRVAIHRRGDEGHTTEFVGRGGKVLKSTGDNPAVYRFTGRELYVRAKVTSSLGECGWVQPVFISKASRPRRGEK